MKEPRILFVETEKEARLVVDCEKLVAFHFAGVWPEIVYPDSLMHASFIRFDPGGFVKFYRRCPNLKRLTLTTDSSLANIRPDMFTKGWNQYSVLAKIINIVDPKGGPLDENELICLERIELDLEV